MRPDVALSYECDRAALGSALSARFSPLAKDRELDDFLLRVGEKPHGFWQTKLMSWAGQLATTYDVHGRFGAYEMHLLSSRAWGELLAPYQHASLLDVGAGAGYVTEHARSYFREVVCTETSARLRDRLAQRGLSALALDLTDHAVGRRFAVVSCFNVLDRTPRPLTLLSSLIEHVEPGGLLLLSMPLPATPHVHVKGGTRAPSERLPSLAPSWETAARELSERMIEPAGVRIERLSRLPYVSRGDAHAPLYVLDAALWVCRRALG